MKPLVKIAIAEPSAIVRNGLLSILRQVGILRLEIYEANDNEQLKNTLIKQQPDILIINPAVSGNQTPLQLQKFVTDKTLKCVAMQSSLADSNLLKTYDEVISLYDLPEQIKDKINRLIVAPESDKRHESLSSREKEVIVCVIKGLTNKQIADELCLSTHTIVTHRRNISAKLNIHSTAGLAIYAIVNKLVELDEVKKSLEE